MKSSKLPNSANCCNQHKASLPFGCQQGRLCPARKKSSARSDTAKAYLVIALVLLAYGVVGKLDYEDAIMHEKVVAAQRIAGHQVARGEQ